MIDPPRPSPALTVAARSRRLRYTLQVRRSPRTSATFRHSSPTSRGRLPGAPSAHPAGTNARPSCQARIRDPRPRVPQRASGEGDIRTILEEPRIESPNDLVAPCHCPAPPISSPSCAHWAASAAVARRANAAFQAWRADWIVPSASRVVDGRARTPSVRLAGGHGDEHVDARNPHIALNAAGCPIIWRRAPLHRKPPCHRPASARCSCREVPPRAR
jgi:hypothetical protein